MRIIFFFILAFLTIYKTGAQAKKISAVAFYNVENLFDIRDDPKTEDGDFTPAGRYRYTKEMYQQKLHNVAFVIKQLGDITADGPVLIGLAEIENGIVLADLIKQPELTGRNYQYIHFDGPDPRGIDVALLYRPKYFRPLSKKSISVKVHDNGYEEAMRDVLYVVGLMDKDTIHILVNHWPSRRDGKDETANKRAQLATINKRIVDSLTKYNHERKIIIMGDLNDDPGDVNVTSVLGAGNSKDANGVLYNPWFALHKPGIGTVTFKRKWNLFDQVIISKSFLSKQQGWQFLRAEIFDKEFLRTRSGKQVGFPYRSWRGYHWMNGYSDHFPVVMYFTK